ncbi:elongation factor P hydroxylase [Moraxella sp. Tifton1]|nr:elongation factor P hydroxylase [Moraxella sp. Tifton1]MCL1624055.1 elongation factor P hydroxylase [Moraxella sp. Tifton1]
MTPIPIMTTAVNFYDLSPNDKLNPSDDVAEILTCWQNFFDDDCVRADIANLTRHFDAGDWQRHHQTWQEAKVDDDKALTDWLISLFNELFSQTNTAIPTMLVRGDDEPEYFPAHDEMPARIEFAHGFFASALHEISHWCMAGKYRRTLNDFGYWYEKDGRNAQTQALFEKVEIKPQAIECLFNQACGRYFYVSQDNLDADFDTSQSTFAHDVHHQAKIYLASPNTLPKDAQRLLWIFLYICQKFPSH